MMQWLTKDWGLKLIALVLAIGLWFYAEGEESVDVKLVVPIEIELLNDQMSALKQSVSHVRVTLTAPRNMLSELANKEIKAVHQMGKDVRTAGDYSFRMEPGMIKLPSPQIRVAEIFPQTIHVQVDELVAQKVAIKPDFLGEPAFGFKIREEEIEIDPNVILLEGPKGQLEQLEFVMTDKIDTLGRIRSFRRTVGIRLPKNVKALSEAAVDIFVPIREEFGEKEFSGIPIKVLQTVDQIKIVETIPTDVTFVLKGSRLQLEKLNPEQVFAYIDITNLDVGVHNVTVSIVHPEDLTLKEEVQAKVLIQ